MNPAHEFHKSEPCVFFEGDYRYGFSCKLGYIMSDLAHDEYDGHVNRDALLSLLLQ